VAAVTVVGVSLFSAAYLQVAVKTRRHLMCWYASNASPHVAQDISPTTSCVQPTQRRSARRHWPHQQNVCVPPSQCSSRQWLPNETGP